MVFVGHNKFKYIDLRADESTASLLELHFQSKCGNHVYGQAAIPCHHCL